MVDRAFDGAEAVFWVAPPTPREGLDDTYINFTRPATEAIRREGVASVVVVTALGRGTEWRDTVDGGGACARNGQVETRRRRPQS